MRYESGCKAYESGCKAYESGCKAYESGCKAYEKQGEDACWQLGSVVNDPFDMVPFVRYCCRVVASLGVLDEFGV